MSSAFKFCPVCGACEDLADFKKNAAEEIRRTAYKIIEAKGSTCYVTHFPCIQCAKMLINAGVTRIVYDQEYRLDENTLDFLNQANVELVRVNGVNGEVVDD